MRTIHIGLAALALALPQQISIPAPQGYVNDFAGVIPAASSQRIQRIIEDVRAKSGGEIAVVTLKDLGGRDKADVALQIGRQWGVGRKGNPGDVARNTGVVILLVPKETSSDGRGHIEIQTGSGTEGFITDATAGAIQDEALPFLVQAQYGPALELITLRAAQRYAREFNFTLDTALSAPQLAPEASRPRGGRRGGGINPVLLFVIFVVIMSLISGGRRRRGCGGCIPIFIPWGGMGGGGFGGGRGGWGGGGGGFGGGGFGGFGGGGGFSGGGAGRDW